MPLFHWGLLIVIPVTIAIGQLLFKLTSQKLITSEDPYYSIFFNPIFILALILYGSATLLWIYVLKTAPLAYAYSFMALTFVVVPILARIWLGETLDLRHFIGTALIILGVVIVQS